ncbi:hypothetical protein [Bradyrhizobium elkanii]|uniref:hypothetical protein n=1 Tax=Bradyrhizobium elkanii TaxID=29448 RepID=UPI002167B941|nr:hypothetical protein [Bradyrhizobium elkanii]MCS3519278.1 hypothetical protein [Bradyrhizobium elkanii]MCS4066935.1 hypothetical protein [Bradyrhizobium elkanii]MCS4082470.1 hypothetical protein [Bradyrhizobium elkanii]MCW2127911.1 hypothetical protein [Bradyrhizobium elkanii]MCW2174654.1 hypothetical protein [Bradyrhizobium elkanii]
MQKIIIIVLAVVAAGLAACLGFIIQEPATSTFEIDRDRAALAAALKSAQSELDKYQGGAIKALLDARVEALRHTATMLEQKRASFIRRISLSYTIDGRRLAPASDRALDDILDELTAAQKRVTLAKADADRYSGGLVQSIKLLTVATEELSEAQLRMKFYTAKYGLPLPLLNPTNAQQKTDPPGKVASDKDAL